MRLAPASTLAQYMPRLKRDRHRTRSRSGFDGDPQPHRRRPSEDSSPVVPTPGWPPLRNRGGPAGRRFVRRAVRNVNLPYVTSDDAPQGRSASNVPPSHLVAPFPPQPFRPCPGPRRLPARTRPRSGPNGHEVRTGRTHFPSRRNLHSRSDDTMVQIGRRSATALGAVL